MQFRQVFEDIFRFEILLAAGVFAAIAAALLLALALSRKKSGDRRRRDSHPLVEGGYALVLAAVAGVIVYITASAHDEVREASTTNRTDPAPAAEVKVTAFQWCWQFDYARNDKTVTGVCSEKDRKLPTLIVPAGQPVKFNLTSSDVIHSFWIPDLAVKMDAFPDHTNSVTLTFDHPGRWLGRCAEFCGPYHPSMHFYVRAVPPEQYEQWVQA
ncbi:cytochrome c oxidase subunit II [Prauserella muralis]|uniref:Cytochrome aa3 subunit 2 n=1 Tax=Prauserella muralis TaxID=588067 RepID=A0A2V4B0X1_9PSEU|nr:cytochrome c oxidase subunit II [Prauserella muralis]PXY22205.1 cytochrome c oxidase subunit II [Prauserella muralis]TWE27834.1 cytochrome c oxidase subunit II [Prauserella muralis]